MEITNNTNIYYLLSIFFDNNRFALSIILVENVIKKIFVNYLVFIFINMLLKLSIIFK